MKFDTSFSPRKGYFDFKRIVDSLNLPRAQHVVLSVILAACPNGKLSTHDYPLIVDKIAYESRYSRARTYEVLNDLEAQEILRRDRRKVRNEYGTVRNLPTVYTINLPDAPPEDFAPTSHTPQKAPVASAPTFASSPAPEPQEEPVVEPEDVYDFDDVDPMDPPPGYYEAMCAEHYAQLEGTIPTDDEPQIDLGDDISLEHEPQPSILSATEAIASKPDTAELDIQSPDEFTEEERAVAVEIESYAREKLAPMLHEPKTFKAALTGRKVFIETMYAIGKVAAYVMDEYAIGINQVFYAVDEWIAKSLFVPVPPHERVGHRQQALRLCIFIENKGKHIDSARRRKLGLIS